MHYPQKMCYLCLEATEAHLNDFISTNQNGLSHFEKLAASLTRIANVLELDSNSYICEKCINTVNIIYNFNRVCLRNIERYNSYKTILKGEKLNPVSIKAIPIKTENKTCSDEDINIIDYIITKSKVKVPEQVIVKSELGYAFATFDDNNDSEVINVSEIKVENEETTGSHFTDNIVKESEVEVADKVIVKYEVDHVAAFYDDNIESDCEVKIEILKTDMKQEYWGKDGEEAGASSKIEGNIEEYSTSQTENEMSDSWKGTEKENIKEKEESFTTSIEEISPKSRSNIQDQSIVRCKTGRKNNKYICNECNKTFRWKSHLDRHVRIHTGKKPFTCKVCKKTFTQISTLNTHMRIHSGEKPHLCDICKKDFSDRSNLIRHKSFHIGVKSFSCDICDKSFTQKQDLVRHQQIHTSGKPFACNLCDKAFKHKSALTQHRRLHTENNPYSCNICNKSFSSQSNLKQHKKTHSK